LKKRFCLEMCWGVTDYSGCRAKLKNLGISSSRKLCVGKKTKSFVCALEMCLNGWLISTLWEGQNAKVMPDSNN
jgi:hypothetical protein